MPLLACRGCGSQWVRTEPWTPIDHTGRIPEVVRAELRLRDAPQADTGLPTSGDPG